VREDFVTRTAQRMPPRFIARSLRLEQPDEDVILVEQGKIQSKGQMPPERRLATARQSSDYNEPSALDVDHVLAQAV
jgi:hypothetical protein